MAAGIPPAPANVLQHFVRIRHLRLVGRNQMPVVNLDVAAHPLPGSAPVTAPVDHYGVEIGGGGPTGPPVPGPTGPPVKQPPGPHFVGPPYRYPPR